MTHPLDDWDFELPQEAIARRPAPRRSGSRLMHLPIHGGEPLHLRFADLADQLRPGDLLVGNDTRVVKARLVARRETGARVELLVLGQGPGPIEVLGRNIRRVQIGDRLLLGGSDHCEVVARSEDGRLWVQFSRGVLDLMAEHGSVPLPPYMERAADREDEDRYQTVYAGPEGAAAAPTAGLHFDAETFERLESRGVSFCTVTLHVGLGTFRPLGDEQLRTRTLHEEWFEVPAETAAAVERTRNAGGRVVAIGTTTTRALQSATPRGESSPRAGEGRTTLFLAPPDRIHAVDGLITNFHLPRSSLLMMVACMSGRERLLDAYALAVSSGYRFYSYGDAMLIL